MQEVPIAVAVRVRPLLDQEKLHHENECISFVHGKPQVVLGRDRGFKFDHVFRPDASQDQVYEKCVQQLVVNCMDGYNATVFAYGQTGSGKTFTMGTGNAASMMEDETGIVHRAIKDIFNIISERSESALYRLKVSFIEIYREEARDLLEFETKELHIREDDKGNTVVAGLREEPVYSLEDVLSCLDSGISLRHTASTQMNEYSSRSHCIFTILIERHPLMKENGEFESAEDVVTTSKFHFVDLAGSERAHRTGNQGERFRESISINTGLLALGNVISSLSDVKKRQHHVPYRQSKLTRLLKDSLGGNSRTVMITCLSSCSSDFDENLNSLKYATRVKNIKNKPVINTVIEDTKLAKMENEIQVLKDELLRQKTMPMATQEKNRVVDLSLTKKLEDELERLKSVCRIYKDINFEAASIIKLFYGSDMPPYDIQDRIGEWLGRWENIKDASNVPKEISEAKMENDLVRKLKQEIDKYKSDLKNDEEIFVEKTKLIEDCRLQIKELEDERAKLISELEKYLGAGKLQEEQRFRQVNFSLNEQQIKNGAKTSEKEHKRKPPRSAPPTTQRRLSILSKFHKNAGSFDDDHVMKSFRARTEMLLSKYEDIDEVSHDEFQSSSDNESDSDREIDKQKKESKGGFGSTFTKELPVFSSRKQQQQTTSIHEKKIDSIPAVIGKRKEIIKGRVLTTPSKLPVRRTASNGNEVIENKTSSADSTKRKLRNVELDLRDAKHKMLNLHANIKQKEELIKDLMKSDKEKQELNQQYKERVQNMEKEIEDAKKELEETKSKLDNFEKQGIDKQKIEKEYKRKLKNLEAKMVVLQKKQSEADSMSEFRDNGERKINDLEGNIERLRNQYENMAKKLKIESEKKAKLEQELSKGVQKIKELEMKTDQQSKLLKRKTEEVVSAQRKLRNGTNVADDEEKNDLEAKRKKIDAEIERIVQQKKEVNELEAELQKREEIVMKKEMLLSEKYGLEMKKLRSSQMLNKDVMRLSVQLDDVQKALADAKRASIISKDKSKFQEDIEKLVKRKSNLDHQRKELEMKLEEDDVLEPTEERRLVELMEAVEALDMAIEYKNEVIAGKEKNLEEGSRENNEKLLEHLNEMDGEEMKGILQKYFEKVIALKDNERKALELKDELEIELMEKERLAQELQHCLSQTEARAEKRLVDLEREHEKQVQFLVQKMNDDVKHQPSADTVRTLEKRIQELEKDLFYYKKTSRELKHRLRDASGSSTSTVVESVVSEKQPVTRTHSERSRDSNSLAQSEEKRVSVGRVASPELQTNKVLLNENFYLPPVQRSIQDEKKSKNSQKDEPKSQKSQKGNYDRLITQEEQRRLKEIFETRQQTSKLKREQKPSRSDTTSGHKSSQPHSQQHHSKDSSETVKNPWS